MFKKSTNAAPVESAPKAKARFPWSNILVLILLLAAAGGTIGTFYFYKQYQYVKRNPNAEAQKKTEGFIQAVGKLMELPKDEIPTIATIAEKDKLASQPFFANSENGDILLAYTTAMKAILYRPSTNKIINVAPISINANQPAPQQEQAAKPASLRVAYYNGTDVTGASGNVERLVKSKYPSSQTTVLANAAKKDYTQTLVVDLSGKHTSEADVVAQLLNGKVGVMPEGEKAPDADLLVIYGKQ